MTAFSDLLNSNPMGMSARQAASRAAELGIELKQGTIAGYFAGTNRGTPSEKTLDGLSQVLGIPIDKLRVAANLPAGERDHWTPPPEADRLTQRQRAAVEELIRSIAAPSAARRKAMDELDAAMEAVRHGQRLRRQLEQLGLPDSVMDKVGVLNEIVERIADLSLELAQTAGEDEDATVDLATGSGKTGSVIAADLAARGQGEAAPPRYRMDFGPVDQDIATDDLESRRTRQAEAATGSTPPEEMNDAGNTRQPDGSGRIPRGFLADQANASGIDESEETVDADDGGRE